MSLPARVATLFPYTTLFRSEHGVEQLLERDPELLELGLLRVQLEVSAPGPGEAPREEDVVQLAGDPGGASDRKSTRLNSSHRTISYAVFCLKKKMQFNVDEV